MKIVREITKWRTKTPNHVYVLDDSMTQMIAYLPEGLDVLVKLTAPIQFNRRGRKFVPYEVQGEPDNPTSIAVQGSKGNTYYLTKEPTGWTCTCPGFTYRGKCKHVASKEKPLN
jgi:SWIM zinc finger